MNSKSWGPELLAHYTNMSHGDRSTFQAALVQPDAVLMTDKCTAKDLFWIHLSWVGMSEPREHDFKKFPEAMREKLRIWGLTERAHEVMHGLAQTLATDRVR